MKLVMHVATFSGLRECLVDANVQIGSKLAHISRNLVSYPAQVNPEVARHETKWRIIQFEIEGWHETRYEG